jgi:hypothetical protein
VAEGGEADLAAVAAPVEAEDGHEAVAAPAAPELAIEAVPEDTIARGEE